jgi:hypothetical protein
LNNLDVTFYGDSSKVISPYQLEDNKKLREIILEIELIRYQLELDYLAPNEKVKLANEYNSYVSKIIKLSNNGVHLD